MEYPARSALRVPRTHGGHGHEKRPAVQGADLHRIREFNRLLVLNYVRDHGPITRVMLARCLGLSRTTVSSIIDTLLQEGLVREGRFLDAAPTGGRRAILVHFNTDAGRVLGIDVGRTHLTMLITNLAPEILMQRSVPFDTNAGPDICLPSLIAEIRAFVDASQVSWESIIGIGLGIPGPLDVHHHKLSSPPHMPGWDDVDIWQSLQDAFKKPLFIDKDTNMGALGESRRGAGRHCTEMAYIKVGTGIGSGLIINGQIYRGHSGSAGELGHLSIDEDGPPCVCGNRGCLETMAGAQAIVLDACQGLSLARSSDHNGKPAHSPLLANRGTVDIVDVIHAAQQGDAASIAALERAGARIGLALAGLINLFNPESIVIDGGVARAGEILLAPLRRVVVSASLPAAWRGTRIVLGELEGKAIALGGVFSVLDAAFGVQSTLTPSSHAEAFSDLPIFYRS